MGQRMSGFSKGFSEYIESRRSPNVLVVGMVGAGKSSFINLLTTKLMGSRHCVARDSQVSVTKALLKVPVGSFNILDTVGFGYSVEDDGISFKDLFEKAPNEIDAIIFIRKSMDRLSDVEIKVFNLLEQIYGDISSYMIVVNTMRMYGGLTIKDGRVGKFIKKSYNIDNTIDVEELDVETKEQNVENQEPFIRDLIEMIPTCGKRSRSRALENIIGNLNREIDSILNSRIAFEVNQKNIKNREGQFVKVVESKEYYTKCLKCDKYCHRPCGIEGDFPAGDKQLKQCAVFSDDVWWWRLYCSICKDHWTEHVHNNLVIQNTKSIKDFTDKEIEDLIRTEITNQEENEKKFITFLSRNGITGFQYMYVPRLIRENGRCHFGDKFIKEIMGQVSQ